MAIATSILIFFVLGFLFFQFRIYLLFTKQRLPILMYHSILPESDGKLTVAQAELEKQFKYIAKSGYSTCFFKDLPEKTLTQKTIILTFDDGFENNLLYAVPLLKKYGLKATFFVNTQKIIEGNFEGIKTMSFEQLQSLDSNHVEIALHTHQHQSLKEISLEEITLDLQQNIEYLEKNNIPFSKILAYPYGEYPKDNKTNFFNCLTQCGIEKGFKIGNRVNAYPFKNPFEIHRIDIKGGDSLKVFKIKILVGKIKLF